MDFNVKIYFQTIYGSIRISRILFHLNLNVPYYTLLEHFQFHAPSFSHKSSPFTMYQTPVILSTSGHIKSLTRKAVGSLHSHTCFAAMQPHQDCPIYQETFLHLFPTTLCLSPKPISHGTIFVQSQRDSYHFAIEIAVALPMLLRSKENFLDCH